MRRQTADSQAAEEVQKRRQAAWERRSEDSGEGAGATTPTSTVATTSLGAVCHWTLTTWRAGIMAAWDHLGTSGNMEGYLD